MNITFVINHLGAGGAERVLCGLANHWAQQHEVKILTFAGSGHTSFYPLDPRINVIHLGLYKDRPSFWVKRLWGILIKLIRLRRYLKQERDAVISFMTETNIAVLIMNKGLGNKVIVSERIDPAYHSVPRVVNYLRLKTYQWAHRIIVQTKSVADYFPAFLQPRISIIPNAVPECSVSYEVRSRVKEIVTVGRLAYQKDHLTLIKAFSHVVQSYPQLRLTIYGEGPERKSLELLIHQLNLQEKVFLPGIIENVSGALATSDLFILPSRYEGFPNALCEAMAMGLPVIASACSGNTDIVRNGVDGILFPIEDVEALSKAMKELIDNEAIRQSFSLQATEITSRFSEEHIWKLWEKVVD